MPSMVLQPHVQNAIWHGLAQKNTADRKIEVRLEDRGPAMCWQIIDNGVGRKQGNTGHAAGSVHRPSGVELTRKRLALLRNQHQKPYSIEIIDLKQPDNQPAGTQVNIIMYKSPVNE